MVKSSLIDLSCWFSLTTGKDYFTIPGNASVILIFFFFALIKIEFFLLENHASHQRALFFTAEAGFLCVLADTWLSLVFTFSWGSCSEVFSCFWYQWVYFKSKAFVSLGAKLLKFVKLLYLRKPDFWWVEPLVTVFPLRIPQKMLHSYPTLLQMRNGIFLRLEILQPESGKVKWKIRNISEFNGLYGITRGTLQGKKNNRGAGAIYFLCHYWNVNNTGFIPLVIMQNSVACGV